MPARIGYNGFSASRREGDGTTPAGTFGFVYGLGSRPTRACAGSPTAACGRTRAGRVEGDDNRWVTRPCSYSESLWKNRRVGWLNRQ